MLGQIPGAIRSWMANRKQSTLRAVGGTLSLMPDRLEFRPHAVDAALAGQVWSAHLSQIRAVSKEGVNLGDFFSGGIRSRLRIDLWDGSHELFVVWSLDEVIQTISSCLASGGGQVQGHAAACGGCGAPLGHGQKFCGQCGRPCG